MRIVLTGGGTGGHFYPLIAVADALYEEANKQKLLEPELHYLAPDPYDRDLLDKYNIEFHKTSAGKIRTYTSLKNFFDLFKISWGIIQAIWIMFVIYPDVVFAKGGYVSFPALVAARLLRIPVFIHESDSIPGRVNRWAGKFAAHVSISYEETADYFATDKIALTGNPIRPEVSQPALSGAREYLEMDEDIPVLFVLGGSQGAQAINSVILEALPQLLEEYYIIHQVGENNLESVNKTIEFLFSELPRRKKALINRYKSFAFLDNTALRMSAGATDLVISRAGSTIFEIAAWAVPSILIPLPIAHANHQIKNAYNYARAGAATVIEEDNLSDGVLLAEIKNIMNNADKYEAMTKAAAEFARLDSAQTIAEEILHLGHTHKN